MRQHRVATAVLLAAAALLLAPATSSAQMFGFGRFGGGYYGAYAYSPYVWGYAPVYGTYGWSYPASTWGYYGYPSYATGNSYYNAPAMSLSYGYPSGTDSYYSYGAPSSTETRDSARLKVQVPDPNADVWVEGKRTQQRGTRREYVSPPLSPDKSYTYEVRARWTENGKDVERTKTVPVRANGTASVDFTASTHARVDEIDRDQPRTNPDKGPTPPKTGGPGKP